MAAVNYLKVPPLVRIRERLRKNYQCYLQFAEWLKKQLQAWKEPERRLREDGDMLDIQAFCYIIYQQHKKKADLTT